MKRRGIRRLFVTLSMVLAVLFAVQLLSGCALTHLVDENFAGIETEPKHPNKKALGYFLLPFAAAADIATSPIQAIMLIVGGDEVLYEDGEPFWKHSSEE